MDLGGGMVWALDLDDFTNRCGQGKHPLMNTIKKVLGPQKGTRIGDNNQQVQPGPSKPIRQFITLSIHSTII